MVDYIDTDFNNVCAAEAKLIKVEMVSDILHRPVNSSGQGQAYP